LNSLKGQVLEAVEPLSQLFKRIKREEVSPSMDQMGEVVEIPGQCLHPGFSGMEN